MTLNNVILDIRLLLLLLLLLLLAYPDFNSLIE